MNRHRKGRWLVIVAASLLLGGCGDVDESKRASTLAVAQGNTAMHAQAYAGNLDVVELLIQNGLDVNAQAKDGGTPLHRAAYKGHADIVELLVANGAKIDIVDAEGHTPIDLARAKGNQRVVELLVQAEASTATDDT